MHNDRIILHEIKIVQFVKHAKFKGMLYLITIIFYLKIIFKDLFT